MEAKTMAIDWKLPTADIFQMFHCFHDASSPTKKA